MRHTGGLLRRAVSMVVLLEIYGLEARFGPINKRDRSIATSAFLY